MRNNKFETPLDLAALYGRLEVVKMLLSAHPNLLSCSTRKHTPLHLAARNGHKAVVQVLLDAGMDSNYQVARRAPLLAQGRCRRAVCVLSTFHITLTCFRLSLFCCDILELCGVSLVVLLVSFQGMRYSLEPLKRSACGPSQTRRVHCLPIHGPHLLPPPPFLHCQSFNCQHNLALLCDGKLLSVSTSVSLVLTFPVGREVLLFPLLRKVELSQVLGVSIPTSSGDSCTWPEMAPKWSCCVDFLEPIQELLES